MLKSKALALLAAALFCAQPVFAQSDDDDDPNHLLQEPDLSTRLNQMSTVVTPGSMPGLLFSAPDGNSNDGDDVEAEGVIMPESTELIYIGDDDDVENEEDYTRIPDRTEAEKEAIRRGKKEEEEDVEDENWRREQLLKRLEERDYKSEQELSALFASPLLALEELNPELRERFFQLILGVNGAGGLVQDREEDVRESAAQVIGAALASGALSQEERKMLIKALTGKYGAGELAQGWGWCVRMAAAKAIGTALASDAFSQEECEAERNVLIEVLAGKNGKGGLVRDDSEHVRGAADKAMSTV